MRITYISPEKLTADRAPALQTLHTVRELCGVHNDVEFVTPWSERTVRKRALQLTGIPLPESLRIVSVGAGPDLPFFSHVWPSQVWSGLSKRLLRYGRGIKDKGSQTVVYTRHRRTAALLARDDCPPLVFEYHEPESIVIRQRVGDGPLVERVRREELTGVRHSAALVTVGLSHARQAPDLYEYDGPVAVIRNGAAPDHFSPREDQRCSRVGRFLYVGSLDPWKGLAVALQAVAMVPPAELHICGGSPRDPQWRVLENRSKELGIEDRFHLHGHVPQTSLRAHMASAQAGLLPIDGRHAIAEQYTCPLKLLEYMTAGLPTIASDLPSVREIVEHNRQALLFPANNAKRLARLLWKLINNPSLGDELGRRAMATAAEFTWNRRAERILSLCRRVLQDRPRELNQLRPLQHRNDEHVVSARSRSPVTQ